MAWNDLTNPEAWKLALANLLRKGEDVGTYISEAPEKAGKAIVEAGQRQSALMDKAFDPTGKTLIRDPKAANQAAMNLLEGPLSIAPVGITKLIGPQSEAMEIAQKNAALPVSQGGLGLPPNNTAMERAKAMGFVNPVYHGTKETGITQFDPSKGVGVSGSYEGAITETSSLPYTWASKEPHVAELYSLNSNSFRGKSFNDYLKSINYDEIMQSGTAKQKKEVKNLFNQWKKNHPDYNKLLDSATNYPLLVKAENPKNIDAQFETYSQNAKTKPNVLAEKAFSGRKNTGQHDLLTIQNFNDPPVTGWGNALGTHVAIKNPSQIRSKFAAFDPKRINEADILAGVAPLGLLTDEDTRKEILQKLFDKQENKK